MNTREYLLPLDIKEGGMGVADSNVILMLRVATLSMDVTLFRHLALEEISLLMSNA